MCIYISMCVCARVRAMTRACVYSVFSTCVRACVLRGTADDQGR